MTTPTLLSIQASARRAGSVSRQLSHELIAHLTASQPGTTRIERDLAEPLPLLDADWVGANFTPQAERTPEQAETLALSDTLIGELEAADTIVLGVPVYNFAIPAALKAWIDLVARARRTFRYTENGPEGLLKGKTAFVVIASGGTEIGSDIDFASGYLRHILGFIGITDVRIIAADRLVADPDAAIARARADIAGIAPASFAA